MLIGAARIFYALAAAAVVRSLYESPNLPRLGRDGEPAYGWVGFIEMAVIAAGCYAIGRALRRRHQRRERTGAPPGRRVPRAILLPALFLALVIPGALFVLSGAGTHMSPLLLYPFATPWWLVLPHDTGAEEMRTLLAGSGVNAVLLAFLGMFLDSRL